MDEDFVTFKVDMKNAFKIVSRQAVLNKCATLELLRGCLAIGAILCCGTHLAR